jgi:hypothetical protein
LHIFVELYNNVPGLLCITEYLIVVLGGVIVRLGDLIVVGVLHRVEEVAKLSVPGLPSLNPAVKNSLRID